ncbi:MAG: YraN family protein [Patescibacteria group bacterium]
MELSNSSRKDIGNLGEQIAAEYLRRRGFTVVDRNIVRKTGELDVVARKGDVLHVVEVKTVLCDSFPNDATSDDQYDPSVNLHAHKIQKVARTAEWYVASKDWKGEWQVDGILVWLRAHDGLARVRYFPQIL